MNATRSTRGTIAALALAILAGCGENSPPDPAVAACNQLATAQASLVAKYLTWDAAGKPADLALGDDITTWKRAVSDAAAAAPQILKPTFRDASDAALTFATSASTSTAWRDELPAVAADALRACAQAGVAVSQVDVVTGQTVAVSG